MISKHTLEAEYNRLEKLAYKIDKNYSTPAIEEEQRRIRDFFKAQNDLGARFLIKRLDKMNADEELFLRGSDEPIRVVEFIDYQMRQGKSASLKVYVCNILADMYAVMSPETEKTIVRTIVDSFTPSSYFREDVGPLILALERIGPSSVPAMLELSNHRSEVVRCAMSTALESLKRDFVADQPDRIVSQAPGVIPCRAVTEEREAAINSWRKWWNQTGQTLKYPKLPSFFDLSSTQGSKRF